MWPIKTNKVVNGAKVTCKITGFTGIVTGIVTYITGCSQCLVQPRMKEDGSIPDSMWIDIQRLDVVSDDIIKLDNSVTPGCDKQAPKL